MRQAPLSFEAFLEILERRHATIVERRPGMNPGRFKQRRNRAGGTIFVEPELLEGTLARGFEISLLKRVRLPLRIQATKNLCLVYEWDGSRAGRGETSHHNVKTAA